MSPESSPVVLWAQQPCKLRAPPDVRMHAAPLPEGNIPMSTWFIGGCSTGLGRALAEALIGAGPASVRTWPASNWPKHYV
jgi:hypothetical protein